MCERVTSDDPFFYIVYCPNKHITQRMCDKVVDGCLAGLKLILHWFFTNKMIESIFTVLYADENLLEFNEGSVNIIFFCNKMVILNIDVDNINLDNNFDEDHPDSIILIRLLVSLMVEHKNLFLIATKIKKCVIKQLIINLMH